MMADGVAVAKVGSSNCEVPILRSGKRGNRAIDAGLEAATRKRN